MKFAKIILVLILLHPFCGYVLEIEIPPLFSTPEKPLCRVAVTDFYKMWGLRRLILVQSEVSCRQTLRDAGVSFYCPLK
jgi:hypothetical protein